jgi:hypothetical protein
VSTDPNATGLAPAIETLLARIPSVSAARVAVEEPARVSEIHLVADRTRTPKQIVRDVQTVVLAELGIEIDYRTVSIVQLDAAPATAPTPAAAPAEPVASPSRRVELASVSTDVRASVTEVRIEVRSDGAAFGGTARGPASAWEKLVARAVVDALSPLTASVSEVDDVRVVDGPARIALVALRLPSPRGDMVVSGSAPVRGDTGDAIARATLSALNRFLRAT